MSSFQFLGEETIHESWIRFVKAKFRAPSGEEFEREIVHHPGAVSIVPVLEDNDTVLMVRQFRASVMTELLEIPAGKRDVEGEAPEATAHRELAEEVGKTAGRLDLLGQLLSSPGFSDETQQLFLARDLVDTPSSAQGIEEEHMQVETIRLSELDQLIASATVRDAKSVSGLLLAREWIRAGH